MKLNIASATILFAALAVAYPANGNSGSSSNSGVGSSTNSGSTGNSNSGSTGNSNSGSTGNSNSGSTGNSNSGNTNSGNSNNSGINSQGSQGNQGNSNNNANGNNSPNTNANGGSNSAQIQDGNNDSNNRGTVDQQTALYMQTAVDAWMRDTGVVSNFLNIGPNIQDEATFRNQAQIAHSAEVDELTHKAVLDQFMTNNRNVAQANQTLSNGAFQLVVDRLDDMARQGFSQKNGIDDINKDRCVNVLPNIDMYMREAALTIGNGQGIQQSVRPQACANVVAGQNGALKVNEVPAGYVNGKLQSGNSNLNPNIAATPEDDDSPEINVAGETGGSGRGTNNGGNSNNNNRGNTGNNNGGNTANNNGGNTGNTGNNAGTGQNVQGNQNGNGDASTQSTGSGSNSQVAQSTNSNAAAKSGGKAGAKPAAGTGAGAGKQNA